MSTWRVLVGDVRETLATLPDGSVQCVVTSPPYLRGLEVPAPPIERFAAGHVIVRQRKVRDAADRAVRVREVPVAGDFRPVLATLGAERREIHRYIGLLALDTKEWPQRPQRPDGDLSACLPAVERPAALRVRALSVVPPIENVSEKGDCRLVHHPNLDNRRVAGRPAPLAAVRLRLLDPNTPLTIDQTGEVGEIGFGSHVASSCWVHVTTPIAEKGAAGK